MRWIIVGLAATLAMAATTAGAEQRRGEPVFGIAPVGDELLAGMRGTQSPFARLTRASALRITDDQARADLRWTGENARTQMDVWWGTIGSELIAESVRAAGVR